MLGAVLPVADVIDVAAGQLHVCALRSNGGVWCWGANGDGQLGHPASPYSTQPLKVPGLGHNVAAAIAAGSHQTCAIMRPTPARAVGGQVKCWGFWSPNVFVPSPADVPGLSDAIAISCGAFYCCALRVNHEAWCFGDWGAGANPPPPGSSTPGKLPLPLGATSIGTGYHHACAVLTDGSVWCWGANASGQLGRPPSAATDPTTAWSENLGQPPTRVEGVPEALAVSAGAAHTCVIVRDGTVWCWGNNYYGQTGSLFEQARVDSRPHPVPNTGPGGWPIATAIGVGAGHSCAVFQDRSVRCWGERTNGPDYNDTHEVDNKPRGIQ